MPELPTSAERMSDQASDTIDMNMAVPTDPALLSAYAVKIRLRLCKLALFLKNDPPSRVARTLTPKEYAEADRIVEALSTIDSMTPALAATLRVKELLQIVNGTAANTKWVFPAPFPSIATDALQEYESENWGAAEPPPAEHQAAATSSAVGNRSRPRADNQQNPILREPPPNHPIYGTSGIMRGILVGTSGHGIRRGLDPSFPARDSKVFGHNGLSVGQWWPFQICALRDGAHGASVAGIAGGENEGAYSIVVSGGAYDDYDSDEGTLLHYTGSQAHYAPSHHTALDGPSSGTKALQRSRREERPVRVLRSAKGKSVFSPSHGIRYDGLYLITEEKKRKNREGRVYWIFTLVRAEKDQGPIERGRPSKEEVGLMRRVGEGY